MHIFSDTPIHRALKDTFSFWDIKRGLSALTIFGIGTALHRIWTPNSSDTTGEIMLWLTYTIAATVIFGVLLFFFNLFCAPYRVERDAHIETKAKLAALTPAEEVVSFFARRTKFTLKEAACLLAGSLITRGEVVGPAAGYLSDLEEASYRGSLKPIRPIKAMDMTIYKMRNSPAVDWEVPSQEKLEISKAELQRYAEDKGFSLP